MMLKDNYISSAILFLFTIVSFFFFKYWSLPIVYLPPFWLSTSVIFMYIVTRKNIKKNFLLDFEKQSISSTKIVIVNILYVLLFTASSLLILISYNQRPILYFWLIAAIVGILTFEILYLPSGRKYIFIMLTKIGLIAANLRVGIQYIFSHSFIWYDPYYHKQIIESILSNGYIPQNVAYSSIPIFHIFLTCEFIIGGITDFIHLFCINSVLKSFLIVILLYLIGWKILNSSKIGLLSSLLYSVLDRSILYDVSFSPTSFAILLVFIIIFLIFKKDFSKFGQINLSLLILLLMLSLILTHTLTSVLLSILLVSIWLSSIISKIYINKNEYVSNINLLILFPTATLAYWVYVTGYFITQLANIIKWGFKVDEISPYMSFGTTANTLSQIPLSEHILSYLGFYLFASLSILGCLYSFSSKNRNNKYLLFFSISIMLIFMITFLGITLKVYVVPDRWWYYSEHMVTIMVFGLISFVYGTDINYKKIGGFLIVILFVSISFLNITDPVSNMDSPLYSENLAVRHASLSSEIQSINTISRIYDGKILTDIQSSFSVSNDNSITVITGQMISNKNYTFFDGLIILRKDILDYNPFDARGLYKLDHDMVISLEEEKYYEIYDSNIVYGYMKPTIYVNL